MVGVDFSDLSIVEAGEYRNSLIRVTRRLSTLSLHKRISGLRMNLYLPRRRRHVWKVSENPCLGWYVRGSSATCTHLKMI